MNDLPAARRDIAMVFQDYALYPHMTVRQNMAFALEMRGMKSAEITPKINEAAALLGITPYLDRRPKALSGGQRQRVAMGRAIVRDPQVFLFDEPLSNLDAKLRGQVRAEIKTLSRKLRTTMVFVTHDQVEAMTMADRIVVLKSGEIQQIGTPEEVYNAPVNLFVADFIGSPSMNFMSARIENGELVFQEGSRLAARKILSSVPADREVIFGMRPEHLQPVEENQGLPAEITLVEPLGSDTLVHLDMAGQKAIARLSPDLHPEARQRLWLAPMAGKAHLFDPESNIRIAASKRTAS